jgi:ferrous iron transport protein B
MTKTVDQTACTLEQLPTGQSGIIYKVGNKKGPVKRRLVDMGLTPGTPVLVRKVAPLGDPIEVNIRNYELSLRKEDARQILLCPPGQAPVQQPHSHSRAGMVQHIPDEETLRQMQQAHIHEGQSHRHGRPDEAAGTTRPVKLALAGNPNSGKTTLFNALTGSSQYVGNWPGVTVEKMEGHTQIDGKRITVVDLPGIYSLSPYSMEEIVARNFIVGENPDAVINIVDATNIERNLYLTVQLLELERPMVVALNFMDEVRRHGDFIDCDKLSAALGVPVIPITARSGANLPELLRSALHQAHAGFTVEPDNLYDDYTHEIHHKVGALIHDKAYSVGMPAHWASIKLIVGDKLVENSLGLDGRTEAQVEALAAEYEGAYDLGDRETLLADSRYRFIQKVVNAAVGKGRAQGALTATDRIDAVVTNRYLAIPIFLPPAVHGCPHLRIVRLCLYGCGGYAHQRIPGGFADSFLPRRAWRSG